MAERQKRFTVFSFFVSSLPIFIHAFSWIKKEYSKDAFNLEKAMVKDISGFFESKFTYFARFSQIKIYYDKGQLPISRILNLCVAKFPLPFLFKEQVKPEKYRLFQVADFVTTIRLYEFKMKRKTLSKSERVFVDSRHFKKIYLSALKKKEIP